MQQSIWQSTTPPFQTQQLANDTSCSVCIVGGGLTGIYTAFLLAKRGLHVILIEGQPALSSVATGLSTGKLSAQHGILYSQLTADDGRSYYRAQKSAIELALDAASSSLFSRADSYLYATTTEGEQKLQQEYLAYRHLNIHTASSDDFELSIPIKMALRIQNEAQINPISFAQHYAKLAIQYGCEIYTNSRVQHLDVQHKTLTLQNDVTIQCQHIILCTHYPISSLQKLLIVKLAINRSYLTATPSSELLKGQYLSVDQQSRTIRTALINNEPYLIYGGVQHAAGAKQHTNHYYQQLHKELHQHFDLAMPTYSWSSQDVATPDLLPYVGSIAEGLSVATGFNKWGLSNSLVAGEILCATLCKENHLARTLFSPQRDLTGRALLKVLGQAGYIGEQLLTGYAARFDAPKCTHLGCKTRWNEGDQTWDCPCHGSRYSADGHVIEGPAVYPLKNIRRS